MYQVQGEVELVLPPKELHTTSAESHHFKHYRLTVIKKYQQHHENIQSLLCSYFLQLFAQNREANVSSNWTDGRFVQGSCFSLQLRELTLEHVQSTDEELVGVLHTDTDRTKHSFMCKCTNYSRDECAA